MNASAKDQYRQLCNRREDIPLFMQPWWMDAVCIKGRWDVCLARNNGEQIAGALVYCTERYRGLADIVVMPPLTHSAGIWFDHTTPLEKVYQQQTFVKRITRELIAQLPRVAFFAQKYHYTFTDWQPFFWEGYRQTTRYTYVLDDLSDTGLLYDNMNSNIRHHIRKADKELEVYAGTDLDEVYRLQQLTFARQGLRPPFSRELLQRVDDALSERGLRTIYFAKDSSGQTHASVYVARDARTAYYLLGGTNPSLRQGGALDLLLWQAIQDAAARQLQVFDFEGSMLQPVEQVFRYFGAIQKPYFLITKARNRGLELLGQWTGKI